jgi:tetratricopeptide (TPR) repeat protein
VDAPAKSLKKNPPTGWRKWLFRLLAMTLVPALFFAVLELGLRLGGYGYPAGFFLPSEIDGRKVTVDNPRFGQRFFPAGMVKTPLPFAVPAEKPPNTYRIFVLGESAAQGLPDPHYSFARILEVMLRERYPATHFEVVNTSIVAINSNVILPIAEDCAGQQPDLFVVYAGNNEVVGPFGAANVLGRYSASLAGIRANIRLKATRVGQLVHDACGLVSREDADPQEWQGFSIFLKSQLAAADPRLEGVYDHFRKNLQDVCGAGRGAGAKVLVCTMACNLKDSAPFASLHRPDLSGSRQGEWDEAYQEGVRAESAGNLSEALRCYERAAAVDDRFADLQFRLARCLEGLNNYDEARAHYTLARDLDALRFRADSRINEVIREVAAGREGEGVYLVDAERAFADASPHGIPGENLFYEHVHLNFDGNYVLARAVFQRLTEVLPDRVRGGTADPPAPPSEQLCMERLGFTDWARLKSAETIDGMLRDPPFTGQLDRDERDRRFQRAMQELKKARQPEALRKAVEAQRRAVDRAGEDWMLRSTLADMLVESGDLDSAAHQVRMVLKQLPHSAGAHYQLAYILSQQGQTDKAKESCQRALKLSAGSFLRAQGHCLLGQILCKEGHLKEGVAEYEACLRLTPTSGLAHFSMGLAQEALGDTDQAVTHLAEAARLGPDNPETHYQLTRVLVAHGKTDKAIRHYVELLETRPPTAESHSNLASLLVLAGRRDEAVSHYTEALRLNPEAAEVHANLGTLLAEQGKTEEAIREYREALRLRPGWGPVSDRLGRLERAQGGGP